MSTRNPFSAVFVFVLGLCVAFSGAVNAREPQAAETTSRLSIADLFRLGWVSDPQVSPDGARIAYTVTRDDLESDKSKSRIWVVPAAGGEPVPMTAEDQSSSQPRWSPDGRYLAFKSARNDKPGQVFRLSLEGGEAIQLTDTAQSVNSYEWSPDSLSLVLVLQDPKPQEIAAKKEGDAYEEKTPPPFVIDRFQFKEDYVGYLDRRRTHLYRLDIASKVVTQLTTGDFDDDDPAWSPDGSSIAFVSNRSAEPDRNYNTDIWVVSADPGKAPAQPLQVTLQPGPDDSPSWSPDGKRIAHTSATDLEANLYATQHLAVTSAAGGDTRVLTESLDRMIFNPRFSPDGRHIWFLLEDSGEQNLARIRPAGGAVERLVTGSTLATGFDFGPKDSVAVLISQPQQPDEVFRLKGKKLEQLTFTNRAVLQPLTLGAVEKVRFKSKDGTEIEGFVILPSGYVPGQRYPAILDIHGGPQSQYDYQFSFEAQLYAANGYVVIHPNPRGSTGYGQAFCLGIWQDWGGPDSEDVLAAVDYAIERGWADPDRLGVGGWSYGGILTNHVITRTDRFKAAISGASEFLYVVNFGHDHYQRWWTQELGLPWEPEGRARYERISPMNQAAKIVTPTLVMGGAEDWNVPIINGEQLYLALKYLGVETELVVYPGESHGIDTPSHMKDLYERYLAWFGKYLGVPVPLATAVTEADG